MNIRSRAPNCIPLVLHFSSVFSLHSVLCLSLLSFLHLFTHPIKRRNSIIYRLGDRSKGSRNCNGKGLPPPRRFLQRIKGQSQRTQSAHHGGKPQLLSRIFFPSIFSFSNQESTQDQSNSTTKDQ